MTEISRRKYLVKSIWENSRFAKTQPLILYRIISEYKKATNDYELEHIEYNGVNYDVLINVMQAS